MGEDAASGVLNRDRAHTRDLLAGTFWPDRTESRARRRLSHTLWQVQSVLDEVSDDPFILATPNTLQFNVDAGAQKIGGAGQLA